MCRALCILTLAFAGAAHVSAQSLATYILLRADGSTQTGRVGELDKRWNLRFQKGISSTLGNAIVSIRQTGQFLPAKPLSEQLILGDGSRIPGELVQIANDRVQFQPRFANNLGDAPAFNLSLSAVAAVYLGPPRGIQRLGSFLRRLTRERRKKDIIWKRNGDRIEGNLLKLEGQLLVLQNAQKKRIEIKKSLVAVLAFNTDLVTRTKPKAIHGLVVLSNGGRFLALSAEKTQTDAQVRCKIQGGGVMMIPLEEIVAITWHNGCAEYLSDLRPARFEHTPYFGVPWPLVRDGSVTNCDLRLGNDTFDKGLGMHAKSRVTYHLSGRYRTFAARVGLDANTGKKGRVKVQVLVDGKLRDIGWSKELTCGDKPLLIQVDVTGAKELTLVVDFGRRGDVQCHVNWAEARLIKLPK